MVISALGSFLYQELHLNGLMDTDGNSFAGRDSVAALAALKMVVFKLSGCIQASHVEDWAECGLFESWAPTLKTLNIVSSFALRNTNCLSGLTGLTDLSLRGNEALHSIKGLQPLHQLRKLNLVHTHVCSPDHGMNHRCQAKYLVGMANLRVLHLPEVVVNIETIFSLPQIVDVLLPGRVTTDALLHQAATHWPLLEVLVVTNRSCSFPREFSISGVTKIPAAFQELTRLRTLVLPACPNLCDIAPIASLSSLAYLEFWSMMDEELSECQKLVINGSVQTALGSLKLQTLKMPCMAYDESIIPVLTAMHDTLTELNLVSMPIPDAAPLAALTQLKKLSISGVKGMEAPHEQQLELLKMAIPGLSKSDGKASRRMFYGRLDDFRGYDFTL
jgi:hypothetical protein